MANYITIDGGTTNTRISLLRENEVVQTIKLGIGAKANSENNNAYKTAIKNGIAEILKNNSLCDCDIEKIICCGMITSEQGLLSLPHITLPAGVCELKESIFETQISEISPITFAFVRGLKIKGESLENIDILCGEESELYGITDGEEAVYVLSGSHTKIMKTDKNGKIVSFKTMLTGEMLAVLSQNTILKNALDSSVLQTDGEYLLKGYNYAKKYGINDALFKVRILKNILKCSKVQVYNFYMGVVLSAEADYILSQKCQKTVLSGNKYIKEYLAALLKQLSVDSITVIPESISDNATAYGMIKIYETKNRDEH